VTTVHNDLTVELSNQKILQHNILVASEKRASEIDLTSIKRLLKLISLRVR